MTIIENSILDFRGIDSPEKAQPYLDNIIAIESNLRDTYIKRLQTFNKENLENNPEPFRFLEKENCSILVFILPYEFNFSSCCQIFFLSTPASRIEKTYVLTKDDLSDLDSYEISQYFFYDKMLPMHNFQKSQIIIETSDFYPNIDNGLSPFSESFNMEQFIQAMMLIDQLLNTIKTETINFRTLNETKLSYFAKDAYKFPFSLLDLKPLIELVGDDDFSYQLDQAMAAYHENLFLPCAATLGVVLETLCIKILENNGVTKIKAGDTQLGKLKDRLMDEKIITRRDNTRLEVAYKMRNMASHSSPGIALKEDCHFMLNVINTIAFEYLENPKD